MARSKDSRKATAAPAAEQPLAKLTAPAEPDGLSLEGLSQAFAAMLSTGDDPYAPVAEAPPADAAPTDETAALLAKVQAEEAAQQAADQHCELSPRSILEAMLFVGTPGGETLTSAQVASLMRGVRAAEIDDLVRELNASYRTSGCPYTIESVGAGYRMALKPEFAGVRERFYGRVRQAKLSPAAIEVLAAVAYNESLTAEELTAMRGNSNHLLTQLVRRQLLRIERSEEQPNQPRYFTTPRFLQIYGLDSLADLPQSQDLDVR